MSVVLHTSYGDLPVALHYKECPRTCFNFLALCASGYYDGCQFYRHFPGTLLQTGDPTNTGKGGDSIFTHAPDDKLNGSIARDRFFDDEGFGALSHNRRGVLSMAHKGPKPNTNASQFFVLCAPQPSFDNVYTAFGEVLLDGCFDKDAKTLKEKAKTATGSEMSGEEVLRLLEEEALLTDNKGMVLERESILITGTTILYNPFAEGKARI